MNIFIRDAEVYDAIKIREIYKYYVVNTAKTLEYTIPSAEDFVERIKKIKEQYPYLVAVSDDNLVGYCYASAFRPRIGYKYSVEVSIYTDKEYSHKGIGSALYKELENKLIKAGIKNMNACIVTSENDSPYLDLSSLNFHQKMGFDYVGTFHKSSFKFGEWFDMTWMEKIIGEHS